MANLDTNAATDLNQLQPVSPDAVQSADVEPAPDLATAEGLSHGTSRVAPWRMAMYGAMALAVTFLAPAFMGGVDSNLENQAQGAIIRTDVTLDAYIERADSMYESQSVGVINTNVGTPTGFYIGDGMFVTTAHGVLDENGDLYAIDSINFGSDITNPSAVYGVDQVFIHPNATGNAADVNDIAVLFSVDLANSGIAALELASEPLPEGVVFDLLTYGEQGVVGQSDPLDPARFMVAGEDLSNDSFFGSGFFEGDFNLLGSSLLQPYEIGASPGSSGSPAIYNDLVYGIANYTISRPEPGYITGYENVSNSYDWVENEIRPLAQSQVTVTTPEPSTLSMAAILAGAAGLWGLFGRGRKDKGA